MPNYETILTIVIIAFAIILITWEYKLDSQELQSRINQCNNDVKLEYPQDNRSAWNPSKYIGYGGINLLYPCEDYRNYSTAFGFLFTKMD